MSKNVIHIYGASGSGTTTLAKHIHKNMNYFFMDTDDYFWLPTNPPYIEKRKIQERVQLMREDIEKYDKIVISGSLVNWGNELIPFFSLAVRLVTDTDIRIARLKEREKRKFGSRIEKGGDMYQNHLEFIEWAAKYDNGDINMRSKAQHDEWQKLLKCKQIVLNGTDNLDYNLQQVKNYFIKEVSEFSNKSKACLVKK